MITFDISVLKNWNFVKYSCLSVKHFLQNANSLSQTNFVTVERFFIQKSLFEKILKMVRQNDDVSRVLWRQQTFQFDFSYLEGLF